MILKIFKYANTEKDGCSWSKNSVLEGVVQIENKMGPINILQIIFLCAYTIGMRIKT